MFLFAGIASAQPSPPWWLAESGHFQVYSHVSGESARKLLDRFELLRSFWTGGDIRGLSGLLMDSEVPLRVLEFNSPREYDEFRSHAAADAYYVGSDAGEYIVLPPSSSFGISAHEYAHAVFHARGLQLPDWLSEGLAEVFSTVQVTSSGFEFGGDLPARLDTLRRRPLIPLSEFFDGAPGSKFRESREVAAVFYAESWAIAGMLISSPDYGRLDQLFQAIRTGKPCAEVFATVYGKPPAIVNKDLRSWIGKRNWPRHLIPRPSSLTTVLKQERLPDLDAGMLLADLLMANKEWTRAEAKYRSLLRDYPNEPKLLASLGTLAFDSGSKSSALESWKKAIDSGAADPGLCYRFALLAEDARLPDDEIAHALQKAIAGKPDFSDARYHLAILESNRANYAAAVDQLKAMGTPSAARAYSYWSALASALSELGRTEEATAAAHQAILSAKTPEERGIAGALEYTTKTDFHVQFERDKDGQMKAVTIRTPHGTEWNPFIEAGDEIDRTSGQLRTVQCNAGKLVGFSVDTATGPLQLEVSDATRVLMRNSPSEFSCGPQQARPVKVEYAKATGKRGPLLRGMEFQ